MAIAARLAKHAEATANRSANEYIKASVDRHSNLTDF